MKFEYSGKELRELTEKKIQAINADIQIYTDGSTSSEQKNGGAGICIQDREGNVIYEEFKPAGKLCSSYDAECRAMKTATQWITDHPNSEASYVIPTDSQLLMNALQSNDWRDIHEWLWAIKINLSVEEQHVMVCWIPLHCGTEGNERADYLASKGAEENQDGVPVTYNIVKAKIRGEAWTIKHQRAKETYGDRRRPKLDVESKWPAEVRRAYARLRTGHAKELKLYRKFIKIEEDEICDGCGYEEETIHHLICNCPALESRRRMITHKKLTIDMMVSDPEICRRILEDKVMKLAIRDQAEESHTVEKSDGQPFGLQGDTRL